jgi:hypothetical protein
MSQNPKKTPTAYERELAIAANRPIGYHRRIADRVLTMGNLISRYKAIVKKGEVLDTEFLKSTWPGYAEDLKIIEQINEEVRSLDPSITGTDIIEILKFVRRDIAARRAQ